MTYDTKNFVCFDLDGMIERIPEMGSIASSSAGVKTICDVPQFIHDWLEKEIWYRAFYAGSIEYGRDPAEEMPPVDAIERWVKRKGIAKGKDARSTAFAIARSIQKNGTRPHPFLRPAKNEANVRKNEIIQKAVKKELKRHKRR